MLRRILSVVLPSSQASRSLAITLATRAVVEDLEGRRLLAAGPRLTENLDRGVVATRASSTSVFVSWRSLVQDDRTARFNVYRSTNGGAAVKLTASALTGGTNFSDSTANMALPNSYLVKAVVGGVEQAASASYTLKANARVAPLFEIPMRNITGSAADYSVKFTWVGDLNGNGDYEYVVLRTPTGVPADEYLARPDFVEAYKRDGTLLWAYSAGFNSYDKDNIEPGSATLGVGMWDGVTVSDLDCDGQAEVAIRTANGSVFGDGSVLAYPQNDDAQFISVLDGSTGAERARIQVPTDYLSDGPVGAMLGVGYLDGTRPSLVAKFKNRIGGDEFNEVIVAFDFNGALKQKWKWNRPGGPGYYGPYPDGHNIRIVDVDQNGTDEIAEIGFVLNGDGTLRYSLASQGVVHGDRFQIGDFDPVRPGLEGYAVQQSNPSMLAEYYYDANTGQILHRRYDTAVVDIQRGMAADIDPSQPGYEYWSFYGIHNSKTATPGQAPIEMKLTSDPSRPWPNMTTWWDGDLLGDPQNETSVDKWNPATKSTVRLTSFYNYGTADVTKASFYGDIIGDWREEMIFERNDSLALQVFTSQFASSNRLYSLAQNPYYRNGLTIKGYTQSNYVDYYLGSGMSAPPTPNIQPLNFGINAAPRVATEVSASPAVTSGRTTALTVLGTDDGGESALTYTWAALGPGVVTYSANGTNAAKAMTATFSVAGTYTFVATIRDAAGRTITSRANVTVNPSLTSVTAAPDPIKVVVSGTQQFTATARDQFGQRMTTQPSFAWSVIAGVGAISSSGLYTAPTSVGSAVVRAIGGGFSDTATVTVTSDVPARAWWKLDEADGTTVTDSSGGGHDGVAVGSTRTVGKAGNALSFDGNDHVDLPASLVDSAAGSVSMWVKTGTDFASYGMLFYASSVTSGDGIGPEEELYVCYTANENLNLFITGATNVNLTTAAKYADNRWHHVAATWDVNGNAVLYVDGVQTNAVAHNANVFTGTAVTRLGRPGAASRYFTGLIDDVRLYGIAINSARVRTLYEEGGIAPNEAPTVTTSAGATPAPVTGTTSELGVMAADDAGESGLIYTWSASGPAAVTYSANGTNAAKNAVATFTRAGSYNFTVKITDAAGLTATSSVSVTVGQTPTRLDVTPGTATVNTGGTQQFAASAFDQFGRSMATPSGITWSVSSGGGAISNAGLYTAPATAGAASVRAGLGTIAATAAVTFTNPNGPAAPTNLAAQTTQATRAKLTWTDNASNESGFRIWSSRDGMNWTLIANTAASSGAGSSLQFVSGTLAVGTWLFRIASHNVSGESAYSNVASLVI
jgi:rhamnogalacturonan endolyase